ncbi:N-acylethanolamine-hydrolyzing acid amidase-like [Apostichopus japonicus]|uniref:N-acylethanolamine-hydrolyzing acid amidase-like n=1 Tax=Stichopus japonicus TaxID=307972 RepID=UPI003AB5AB3C
MRVAVLSAILIFLAVSTVPGSCVHKAQRFRVDLETPPEERWDHILKQYDIEKFRKIAKEVVNTFIPKLLVPTLNLIIAPLDKFIPEPYASEIKGIAKTSGLGLGEILGLNIVYDVTAFCTSIVAQDTKGAIWHGRNLDYKVTDELKNLTVVVDYYRNGTADYTTTSFLGQVGVFTGMRPHEFTISLNERDQGSVEKNIEALIEALILKKGMLTSFILRETIATRRNFRTAVDELSTTPLVAPVYIIVGGVRPSEGVVITRGQKDAELWHLDAKSGRWWLLETNYDHWVPPPAHDDRRDPGNKAMEKVGQENINERTLFEVLSVEPVLNEHTAYTCLMSAARPDLYDAIIRD